MTTLFAMRRANGDWFAIDDEGKYRVPIFYSRSAAMVARSRDSGMECFKPVHLDGPAFTDLITTDEGKACYWLIKDPLRGLNLGSQLDHQQLTQLMHNGADQTTKSKV